MNHEYLCNDDQLADFVDRLHGTSWIAFDTEFVSEFTYYPDLCLIQVAAEGGLLAVIDPQRIADVRPFWQWLVDGDHETLVHAGREEIRFCRRAVGAAPKRWFDIQLAAGMTGLEYPASYGKLVARLLGTALAKGETRTDWRRRPLTPAQIHYALQDVTHLRALSDGLAEKLESLGRTSWYAEEAEAWIDRIEHSENREKWRRVAGAANLTPDRLKIVREIWRWREAEAQRRDSPPKRILRDDFIVELAKRGKTQVDEILAIRGINRRSIKGHLDELASCIAKGKATDEPISGRPRPRLPRQVDLLEKFLSAALMLVSRQQEIAPGLVGTVQDVRDLITYELGLSHDDAVPSLDTGWRAEIIGNHFRKLLKGSAAIRIANPESDSPLSIEDWHP